MPQLHSLSPNGHRRLSVSFEEDNDKTRHDSDKFDVRQLTPVLLVMIGQVFFAAD